jgi:murein DD-endopeptidase MepM/ murein hydrolase activator NlpD
MDPRLHIIVTSEHCRAKTFVMSKSALKRILTIISLIFVVSTIAGITYSIENFNLTELVNHLQSNVSILSSEKKGLQVQVVSLEEKAKAQLTEAYAELNQRSQMIDSILSVLDISPFTQNNNLPTDNDNKGGPFTKAADKSLEDLIYKVDRDLRTIRPIPLGFPVETKRISSRFGRRSDPVNGESAFHDGIDLPGITGTAVRATADGKVVERGHNDTYGWYIKLDHGNNYMTTYAHNSKILVRRGAKVKRNEVIALLGNTGRSTGPHLHYEIRYNNKPINPAKFVNIDSLVSGSNS